MWVILVVSATANGLSSVKPFRQCHVLIVYVEDGRERKVRRRVFASLIATFTCPKKIQ